MRRGRAPLLVAPLMAAALLAPAADAAGREGAARQPAAEPAAAERPAADHPAGGVAYEGSDRAVVRLAPGQAAAVEEYANTGYRLRRGRAEGEVAIEVSLAPLASRAPFALPPGAAEGGAGDGAGNGAAARGRDDDRPAGAGGSASATVSRRPAAGDPITAAARSAAGDATTAYQAVSAVLGWIVHHVGAAAEAPGGAAAAPPAGTASPASSRDTTKAPAAPAARRPAEVLASGAGDAAEVAGLAVAMLDALGIEARTVRGWVVGPPRPGAPRGAHVWIEVRYPDRGWAFSDPLNHHHYVPASYLRRSGEAPPGAAAELVAREDRRAPVDVYAAGGPGVGARRNEEAQVAAALRVVVPGAADGVAVLTAAGGATQRKALRDGEGVFVGLDGGAYTLEVLIPGRPRLARSLELAPRERSAVLFGGEAAAQREPAASSSPPPPPPAR